VRPRADSTEETPCYSIPTWRPNWLASGGPSFSVPPTLDDSPVQPAAAHQPGPAGSPPGGPALSCGSATA
jgi:hypothetical protein